MAEYQTIDELIKDKYVDSVEVYYRGEDHFIRLRSKQHITFPFLDQKFHIILDEIIEGLRFKGDIDYEATGANDGGRRLFGNVCFSEKDRIQEAHRIIHGMNKVLCIYNRAAENYTNAVIADMREKSALEREFRICIDV